MTGNRVLEMMELGCRILIGVVFCYAGGIKLFDLSGFAVVIDGYGLLPGWLVEPVALTLPLLEVLAGIGLVLRIPGALAAISLMMVLFIAVLLHGIHLGLDIDCGCFGPDDPEMAYKGLRMALYRDILLSLPILLLIWSRWRDRLARA